MSSSESPRRLRRQGPVTLRGKHIPRTTTDQRLLDWRGPSDWVHTDPWRVLRIQAEFVEGFGLLAELGTAVSVFGAEHCPDLTGLEVGGVLDDSDPAHPVVSQVTGMELPMADGELARAAAGLDATPVCLPVVPSGGTPRR